MNNTKYKWVLYSITTVIIITIGIQVYWNYKNYFVNKQQLINDVQISLDNAVDSYYAELAKKTTFGFASFDPVNSSTIHSIFNEVVIDSIDNVFINSVIVETSSGNSKLCSRPPAASPSFPKNNNRTALPSRNRHKPFHSRDRIGF